MTANIGYATLSVIPSFKGALGSLKGELSGPMSEAGGTAGDDASKSFGSKFSGGMGAAGKLAGAGLLVGIGAAVGLAKLGGSFDDAFDEIRTKTGATGETLGGLEESFKTVVSSVPTDFASASTAISSLNQKLGLTGGELDASATQFLNLSRITGEDLATNIESVSGTFNQWGISTGEQAGKLDELFRVSQATGIGVGELSDAMADGGTQFRAAGFSFEDSAALLGTLAENGLDAGAVMPALSKAMATAAAEGRPVADVFKETFDQIKAAPDDASAAALAMETFGAKAGPQFAALIKEGKLSYEDLAASIAGGGDTINEAATSTDDWKEKLQLLGNKAMVALAPIAEKVFNAIGTAVEKVTPFLKDLAAGIQSVFGWLMDNKEVLIGIAIGLGAALVALFVSWAAGAASAAAATLLAAAPFIAIGVAIAAVAAGVLYAYNHFEIFRTVINAVKDFITDDLVPAFQAIWDFIDAYIIPIISTLIETYIKFLVLQFKAVKAVIMDVVIPALLAIWDFITDKVIPIFTAIATTIIETGATVGRVIGEIVGFVTAIPGKIAATVTALWNGLTGGITTAKDWVSDRIGEIVGFVTGIPGKIAATITGLWTDLKAGITTAKDWIGEKIGEAVGFVTGIPGEIAATVTGLWTGIETGITAAKDWVSEKIDLMVGYVTGFPAKIATAASTMWDGIKNAFKGVINSVIGFWNGLHFTLPTLEIYNPLGDNWKIGGQTFQVPKIPLLHQGGLVTGPAGSDQLRILQAGEHVLTARRYQSLMSSLSTAGTPGSAAAGNRSLIGTLNNNRRDIGVADLNQILAMARLAS